MKYTNFGFMLIELIVATFIASLLSGVLLTALSQSTRVQSSIDNTINLSERVAIAYNQLDKDLAGAFIPSASIKTTADGEAEGVIGENEKSSDKKNTQSSTLQPTSEKTSEAQKQKPIEKIFYATNKNGMVDTLTFITNNPLVVFVGKDVGYVKPKVVRVQYTLRPEQDKKDSYVLFRQEANEIDLAEFKNARPYEVIGGIKKLSATYTARIEKKQEQKEDAQQATKKQKKSYEYKVQSDWSSEQKKEANADKDKKEPEFPRIPYSVEFKMTLWDKQENKDKDFTLICHIPVDSIEAIKEDKKQKEPMRQSVPNPAEDDKSRQQQGKNGSSQKTSQNRTTQSGQFIAQNSAEILSNAAKNIKNLLGHM